MQTEIPDKTFLPGKTVYIAKAIGIFLVVSGHFKPSDSPHCWMSFMDFLYKFHMPLFFILSGYLYKKIETGKYSSHIAKKTRRLVYPFISLAIIVFLIKVVPSFCFRLDTPVTPSSFFFVFFKPYYSYAPWLWFMYTLFMIFAIVPLLQKYVKKDGFIFLFSIFFAMFDYPDIFCISNFFYHLPFFMSGIITFKYIDLDFRTDFAAGLLKIFLAAAISVVLYNIGTGDMLAAKIINMSVGFSASAMCILAAVFINSHVSLWLCEKLEKVGVYSASIYLFHTIFESSIRIFFYQVLKINGFFWLKAVLAITAGVVFPVLLEKYVLRRFVMSQKYILGIS